MIRGVNIVLQSRHARYPQDAARLLEDGLLELAARYRAEEAVVQLVDEKDASPRFRVAIFLRLPGPDIHASACDHTVTVAARKALRLVEAQLAARADRRRRRRRSNLQHSSEPRTGRSW